MPTGAQTWSTAAASNNSADSSVNWAEGMAPSAVNNSARAEMASAAMWIKDNAGTLLTSGSTAAYTVTSMQVSSAVTDGYTVAVRFHAANDASATLNVDGVAAKAIELYAGQALVGGEFKAGSVARFTYTSSSTSWVLNNFTSPTTTVALPGSATVASSFEVTKATLLSSALTVSGPATLSSSLTVGLATLFTTGITAAAIAGDMVATQAQQETGTSVITAVSPGRQQYHPSAAKCWLNCGVTGSTSINASYNITTIADGGTGIVDVTIATDFTNGSYAILLSQYDANPLITHVDPSSAITAGTFRIVTEDSAGSGGDPDAHFAAAFGDQA
jgi:hypothetical protein